MPGLLLPAGPHCRPTSGGRGRSSGDPPELRDTSSPDEVVSLLLPSSLPAKVPT